MEPLLPGAQMRLDLVNLKGLCQQLIMSPSVDVGNRLTLFLALTGDITEQLRAIEAKEAEDVG